MIIHQNVVATVLVTGASGFIGTHVILELLNAGYRVIAMGNSSPRDDGVCILPQCLMHVLLLAKCRGSMLKFRRCNLQILADVEKIFCEEHFDVVIHLASSKGVAPSIASPLEYYNNNLISSINLLKMCEKYGHKDLIFMSSATVYGVPMELPVKETTLVGHQITNPYGQSKYMIEQMLRDICKVSKDWNVIILRAFDPAGAHPSGLLGEDINAPGPKLLLPLIASVALGKLSEIRICGNNFPTKDGSGSRDFVHVMDVARAILLCVKRILSKKINGVDNNQTHNGIVNGSNIEIYNLGMGIDHTVIEMVANYEKACGYKINKVIAPTRPGDVATIYCDISAAIKQLDWKPTFSVEEICAHLHKWCLTCPNGYSYASK